MPMSANEVRHALRELEDLRYAAGNLDEALRRIAEATHQLFAVDGAGLMLIDPDQLLRNIAVSDQRIDDLEELQIEHGEGPGVDAFEDKTLVDTEDLAGEDRWPKFSPAALERGLRAVLGQPNSLQPAGHRGGGGVLDHGPSLVAGGGVGLGCVHRPGRAHHR
jgi:GAF domain-containing protein